MKILKTSIITLLVIFAYTGTLRLETEYYTFQSQETPIKKQMGKFERLKQKLQKTSVWQKLFGKQKTPEIELEALSPAESSDIETLAPETLEIDSDALSREIQEMDVLPRVDGPETDVLPRAKGPDIETLAPETLEIKSDALSRKTTEKLPPLSPLTNEQLERLFSIQTIKKALEAYPLMQIFYIIAFAQNPKVQWNIAKLQNLVNDYLSQADSLVRQKQPELAKSIISIGGQQLITQLSLVTTAKETTQALQGLQLGLVIELTSLLLLFKDLAQTGQIPWLEPNKINKITNAFEQTIIQLKYTPPQNVVMMVQPHTIESKPKMISRPQIEDALQTVQTFEQIAAATSSLIPYKEKQLMFSVGRPLQLQVQRYFKKHALSNFMLLWQSPIFNQLRSIALNKIVKAAEIPQKQGLQLQKEMYRIDLKKQQTINRKVLGGLIKEDYTPAINFSKAMGYDSPRYIQKFGQSLREGQPIPKPTFYTSQKPGLLRSILSRGMKP